MKILYTSYFRHPNEVRDAELRHCMKMNIDNKCIDKIIVLLEGDHQNFPEILGCEKVKIIESPRPTFQDFFDIANIISGKEDYSIIANSDIYFDDTLNMLNGFDMSNMCFALSRWHYYDSCHITLHNERFSQDVWIFQGHIKPIGYAHFFMGHPGCDNRIAYEIELAGYSMHNPAEDIKCIHYHKSEIRNYPKGRIMKPYLPVPVTGMPQPREWPERRKP